MTSAIVLLFTVNARADVVWDKVRPEAMVRAELCGSSSIRGAWLGGVADSVRLRAPDGTRVARPISDTCSLERRRSQAGRLGTVGLVVGASAGILLGEAMRGYSEHEDGGLWLDVALGAALGAIGGLGGVILGSFFPAWEPIVPSDTGVE